MSSTGKSGRRVSTAMYRGGNVIGRAAIARDCGGGAKGRGTGSGATGRDGGGGANGRGGGAFRVNDNTNDYVRGGGSAFRGNDNTNVYGYGDGSALRGNDDTSGYGARYTYGSGYIRIRGRGRGQDRGNGRSSRYGRMSQSQDLDELEYENEDNDQMEDGAMLNDTALDDDEENDDIHDESERSSPRDTLDTPDPRCIVSSSSVKIELVPGKYWFSKSEVVRTVSKIIKGSYHRPWLNWSETDVTTRKHWFHRFQKIYTWKPELEQEVWTSFTKKAASRLKDIANKAGKIKNNKTPYFMSEEVYAEFVEKRLDPNFIDRSCRALANRLLGSDGDHVDPGHRQGSVSSIELAERLAMENGGVFPSAAELYLRSHSKKGEGGERILMENKKVKHVMETYHKKVVEYSEEGVEKTENDIFFEVIGGHNKGFVSGLGESAELFYGRRVKSSKVSCTPSLISQIQHYQDEATQAKQKLEEQDAKMHDQETKIKDQANKILDQDKKLEEFEKRLHELSTLINERCSSTSTSVHRHFPPDDPSSGTFGNFVA
ncbi:hypothetical protein RND81_05G039600 [Saponaria officinalis]|uniref:Transposase, Ptta/En/Spm, plant n=1 Tax=Saponaria officinalis TaxID=3572 RepID=A0AAW1KQL5_SAPOF